MKLTIKAFSSKLNGVKAAVTVGIDGFVWINGILVRQGNNGEFLAYPSYKSNEEWKSYIMAKREFSEAILKNYEIGKTTSVILGAATTAPTPEQHHEEEGKDEEFPF